MQTPASSRLFAPDALRGLIMAIMALDHANNFISRLHPRPEMWSGPMQRYSDPLLFLTRFVTHLCAPGFAMLMGAGMMLFAESRRAAGWSEWRIAGFFLVRGALLIALQFLVENPAWNIGMDPGPGLGYVGVLYSLGANMMICALLLRLPSLLLGAVALGSVLATGLLIPQLGGNFGFSAIQRLLLIPGFDGDFVVYYPAIPWLAPVALGLVLGRLLRQNPQRTYRLALAAGAAFLVAFFFLRFTNGFGNIRPVEGTDWMAFFNLVKYPPAPVLLLWTLGVDLILLFLFSRLPQAAERFFAPLLAYGRSPLFFYLAHLYLYALFGLPFAPRGSNLGTMYLLWLLGLLILFPLCWWYSRFRACQPMTSLWRLL